MVSTRYSQVNALRTIEDILGTEHINLNTAFQRPMTEVFDIQRPGKWQLQSPKHQPFWQPPCWRRGTKVTGLRFTAGPMIQPRHDAAYWDSVTAGFDFSEADQVPTAQFNRVLWTGLMGDKAYPNRRAQVSGTREDK